MPQPLITAERFRRKAVMGMVSFKYDVTLGPGFHPEQYQWRIGFACETLATGPAEAAKDMVEQASRAINHEVYGHLQKPLYELLTLLMDEQFRSTGDPVMAKLDEILALAGAR